MNQENRDRLNQLADIVETNTDFYQPSPSHFVVGLARKLYKKETGDTSGGMSFLDKGLAAHFGLSLDDLDALYLAEYGRLNIGLSDVPDEEFKNVTRQTAADVLRRLAARE